MEKRREQSAETNDKVVIVEEIQNELAPELILFADWETYEDAAME